ncbi:MAG: hypothetical protein RMJ66_05590 [Bacteroidia bacterium]|nr:hypothetical protein [Bacteroidia bacterium]MDW8134522.1 hypothetical protein [Bacteroidia bacterium]
MKEAMDKRGILIVGTDTLARWSAQLLEGAGELVYGFAPTKEHPQTEQDSLSILPPITRARIWRIIRKAEADFVLALTDPVKRERMALSLFEKTKRVARSVIHSSVYIPSTARIGAGTILFPYVVIGISCEIGGYVVIESHTVVGANTQIEDFVNIGSGCQIGENCFIGSYSWIGRGAVLCEGVRIGRGARVGPGSTVRENVRAGETYGE